VKPDGRVVIAGLAHRDRRPGRQGRCGAAGRL